MPDPCVPADSAHADPAHLLGLFRQLLPADALNDTEPGNMTLFTSWFVTWVMVWQRSQGNSSLADAVAEIYLGPTFNELPDCKRAREQNISVNSKIRHQGECRPAQGAGISTNRSSDDFEWCCATFIKL